MSDTPRTDRNYIGMQIVPSVFAQQLERELTDANQHVTELENRLRALWDKYYYNSNYYEKRMCALMEAGDVMYDFINPPSPSMRTTTMDNLLQGWDDAKIGKETKP